MTGPQCSGGVWPHVPLGAFCKKLRKQAWLQVLAWQRSLRDVGHMLESLAATQADYDAMQESIALPGRTIKPDAQRTQVQVPHTD